jgi:hypothetical protein
MAFSPTFVLLQQEAYLASGSLSVGLTALRNASFPDKASFYSGFFNTSIAFERVMKLIVTIDHMLENSFNAPTVRELKSYGHDLESLFSSCVSIGQKHQIESLESLPNDSVELEILQFLSEFAKKSRYYNLDALSSAPSSYQEPLDRWGNILEHIFSVDIPQAKKQKRMSQAAEMHNLLSGSVQAVQHGMDGTLLGLDDVFNLPAKHELAVPYAMVRVFNILSPLLELASELGHKGFYDSPREIGPQCPVLSEFFVYFRGTAAQIRRKKRWP